MKWLFASVVLLSPVGCVTATPVTPAPLTADDAPKLRAALIGICDVTSTQNPGSGMKEAKGIRMVFSPDVLHYELTTPFGTVNQDYPWQMDGRNIVVPSGIYKTMRVESWDQGTLKLFIYDISQTHYCTKR